MTNEEKRNAIKKYLAPFPKWAIFLSVIGLIVTSASVGLGIAMFAIGAIVIWMAVGGKPSDQEMDNYIAEDLSHAKTKSLQKTSLDESQLVGETVVITGPRFWSTAGAPVLFKKGKDGRLRFTPINVNMLHMTQDQVVSYQCCLDLTTGSCLNESTDEYFYKDVVSVATKTESKSYTTDVDLGNKLKKNSKIQFNASESFVLTTSGGTYVETMLRDPQLIEMVGGGDIPTTEAERAIQVLRKMLREKKQA